MPSAYFYNDFITRKIRFSNKNVLTTYMSNNLILTLNVQGCNVTNTSSYVDVLLPQIYSSKLLFEQSYVVFDNENEKYFAFIDRVEPNNFNYEEKNSFRLYITIDWFTTLCYSKTETEFSSLIHNIEGNVERAHVNDCKYENGAWHPCIDFTTLEMECPFPRYEVSEYSMLTTGTYYKKKFLYILSTDSAIDNNQGCSFNLGPKDYSTSLNLYVIPIGFIANGRYVATAIGSSPTVEAVVDVGVIGSVSPNVIDFITETSVVAMFISEFCPIYDYSLNTLTETVTVDSLSDVDIKRFNGTAAFQVFHMNEFEVKISSVLANLPCYTNMTNYIKPSNYDEYIRYCIVKANSYPYQFNEIVLGNEKFCLDLLHLESDTVCSYNIDPYGTAYYIRSETTLKVGENEYNVLNSFSAYTPISKNDWLTRLNAYSSGATALAGYTTAIATNLLTKNYGGAIGSAISGSGSLVSTATSAYRSIRDGESGTKLGTSPSTSFFDVFRMRASRIPPDFSRIVQEELALYGYTTTLRVHDILENHKRVYFNYIKCKNTSINVPYLNEDIRLSIEEMFNNGVWLWNTPYDFGNFEVPNYPLIRD